MERFYNGSAVTMENLRKILTDDGIEGNMTTNEIAIVKSFADYNSKEDFEYLLQKLQEKKCNDINWQTIYDLISQGQWNYNS